TAEVPRLVANNILLRMTWLQSSLRSALGQKLSSLVDRKLFSLEAIQFDAFFLAGSPVFDELLAQDLLGWRHLKMVGYGAKACCSGRSCSYLAFPFMFGSGDAVRNRPPRIEGVR